MSRDGEALNHLSGGAGAPRAGCRTRRPRPHDHAVPLPFWHRKRGETVARFEPRAVGELYNTSVPVTVTHPW